MAGKKRPKRETSASSRSPKHEPAKRTAARSTGSAPPQGNAAAGSAASGSSPLNTFLTQASVLTDPSRLLIVEQAIVLLEGFYAHLPLKRAMHAVDPLQRLRLLKQRLASVGSDARFHAEMTSIFTSVRDLHTNYLLPAPFNGVFAHLPFRVEECADNGKRSYIVAGVDAGFQHATFKSGVELLYWNGIPIDRAVEIAADRHAGSNQAARHARGLAGLTDRPLIIAPPPDDEWVIVKYKALDGTTQDIRLDWQVTGLPPSTANADADTSAATFALGLDLETELIQQVRRVRFAPHVETANAMIAASGADPLSAVSGLDSIMPGVLTAREVTTSHGKFGHIRIRTFGVPNNDADAFVKEFIRLIELLPQNGLIVDVRDNGGGLIYAGEQLLQTMTPRTIEAERVQFINTPLTKRLCELNAPSQRFSGFDLGDWLPSIRRSIETGSTFSAAFPLTDEKRANGIGQRYYGPVVLVTNARCYSTTDFFAAGFQDHKIGKILGVDRNTGAGGANVWEHSFLSSLFQTAAGQPLPDSPFKPLPGGTNMRVAMRRSLRVGPQAGTEVEDLGIVPDEFHAMTRNDVLNGNGDLMEAATALLTTMPIFALSVQTTPKPNGTLAVDINSKNVDSFDFYLDDRALRSERVNPQTNKVHVDLQPGATKTLLLRGFQQGTPAVSRRIAL